MHIIQCQSALTLKTAINQTQKGRLQFLIFNFNFSFYNVIENGNLLDTALDLFTQTWGHASFQSSHSRRLLLHDPLTMRYDQVAAGLNDYAIWFLTSLPF